jgi:hypothetical protein
MNRVRPWACGVSSIAAWVHVGLSTPMVPCVSRTSLRALISFHVDDDMVTAAPRPVAFGLLHARAMEKVALKIQGAGDGHDERIGRGVSHPTDSDALGFGRRLSQSHHGVLPAAACAKSSETVRVGVTAALHQWVTALDRGVGCQAAQEPATNQVRVP